MSIREAAVRNRADWTNLDGHPSPQRSETPTKATMASILRRQLARTSRPIFSQATTSRCLSTSSVRRAGPGQTSASAERRETAPTAAQGARDLMEIHTVEDLQGMSAADLLAETGIPRKDAQMRHFTGE